MCRIAYLDRVVVGGNRRVLLGAMGCLLALAALQSTSCDALGQSQAGEKEAASGSPQGDGKKSEGKSMELATVGGGCFWCVEAVFQRLEGVTKVVSGYAGGQTENPNYKQVCTGLTGHAEVCQITYDPSIVSFDEILEVFWQTHDPTTLNRQGNDVGTQYRSVVYYHSPEQKEKAEHYMKKLDEAKIFKNPIVTEISPLPKFYPAEDYHQNYFNDNPDQPYCQAVVKSKVDKFKKVFSEKMKKEYGDR
ncbi:MAG: peptide-methionine (S)-S-oxide reductase MsrA [Pirellulaceae bacterium]